MIFKLKKITDSILSSNNKKDSSRYGIALRDFYFRITDNNFSKEDTTLHAGRAISPQDSAECMQDPVRTVQFVKGVYLALTERVKHKDFLEVVYVGTGVYAPLLLSVLHYFSEEKLNITLMDIHKESIENVKKVSEILYPAWNFNFKVYNACAYQHDKKIDVLIAECMYKGLTRETQISIVRNFKPQLQDTATLIPQRVVLSINGEEVNALSKYEDIKEEVNVQWDYKKEGVMMKTSVEIYNDIIIENNDSTISEDFYLSSPETVMSAGYIQLKLVNLMYPEWKINMSETYF